MKSRGEVSEGEFKHWAKESPSYKSLPARKGPAPKPPKKKNPDGKKSC